MKAPETADPTLLRDWFRQISLLIIAVALFGAAALFVYGAALYELFGSDNRIYTAMGATAVGVVTFTLNAMSQARRSRTQHTIKILFDTRISQEFRVRLERRAEHFTPGEPVDNVFFEACLSATADARRDSGEAQRRYESADALRSLLNYYEFIAVGIRSHDLDEHLLRNTVRAIMCALVIDCIPVIAQYQAGNPKAYENLAWLYASWKLPGDPALTSTI